MTRASVAMGLEATCRCRWSAGAAQVKALLEARELILRGEVRRRIPLAEISHVRVAGGDLSFQHDGADLALELGDDQAARWMTKILTPPPSLAQKLGIGPAAKALVIGPTEDAALREALMMAIAETARDARLSLAVIGDAAALGAALRVHETLPAGSPIWLVHAKGPKASFGEGPVRRLMRDAGYRDNKVCAVSDLLSATRYARPARVDTGGAAA